MAKKTATKEKVDFFSLSDEEKTAYAKPIKVALDKATSKADVVAIWNDNYLTVGHKVLGRLLIGRDAIKSKRGD